MSRTVGQARGGASVSHHEKGMKKDDKKAAGGKTGSGKK
jgi:hypothetical protein